MAFSLTQIEKNAPYLLEHAEAAAKALKNAGLTGHKARIALCLDISGSMQKLYASGKVQRFAEKILTLGCLLDDDSSIEVFLFGSHGYDAGVMSIGNAQGFIDKVREKYHFEGDTNYAEAMQLIRRFYFPEGEGGHKNKPIAAEEPVLVMFVTDGDTLDKEETEQQVISSSFEPIFWQFMAIGKSHRDIKQRGVLGWLMKELVGDFRFLEHLDVMAGRFVDNANFFSVIDPEDVTDDELYGLLMTEYPQWLAKIQERSLVSMQNA
jgi:vWA found in TerF C terminus